MPEVSRKAYQFGTKPGNIKTMPLLWISFLAGEKTDRSTSVFNGGMGGAGMSPSVVMSKYDDPCMPNGLNYPECPFMGKRFHEDDGRCLHPGTGNVYYCATHHINGYPPCPYEVSV